MVKEAGSEARGQVDQISEPWLLQSGLSFIRSGLSFIRSGLSFGFRNSDVIGDLVRAVLVILLTLLPGHLTDLVRWAQKENRKKGTDIFK